MAIGLLFIATLLVGALINYVMGQLVSKTGLSGTDRVLGLCFGGIRGTLIVAAVLFGLDTFTPASDMAWWDHSRLIPEFKVVIQWFFESMAEHSSFLDFKLK